MKIPKTTQILALIVTLTFLSVPKVQAQTKYCNNPGNVNAAVNGTSVTVSWDNLDDADYYYVCVSTSPTYRKPEDDYWPEMHTVTASNGLNGLANIKDVTSSPYTFTNVTNSGPLYAHVVGVKVISGTWYWCLPGGLSTVTTSDITTYSATSATLGGNVTDQNGATVYERGVCWSTNDSPTVDDTKDIFSTEELGTGPFSKTINADFSGGRIYVRAYSENYYGISYGATKSFIAPTNNTAPVANNDTYTRYYTDNGNGTVFSVSVEDGVLDNDTDTDSDALTVGTPLPATNPTHGTLSLNSTGDFTYTSSDTYIGTDSFTYYANDGTVNSTSTATVTLNIVQPQFTNAKGNGLFSDPDNWNCGYVPNEQSLDLIITNGFNLIIDTDYTCRDLKFEDGASFECHSGHTLTITRDVLDKNGHPKIHMNAPMVISTSLKINNE